MASTAAYVANMADFVALTVFAGLPVRDLDSAVQWYSRVFGRGPDGRPTPLIADYYLGADQIPENGDSVNGKIVTLSTPTLVDARRSMNG